MNLYENYYGYMRTREDMRLEAEQTNSGAGCRSGGAVKCGAIAVVFFGGFAVAVGATGAVVAGEVTAASAAAALKRVVDAARARVAAISGRGVIRSMDDVMNSGDKLLRGKSPAEVESILKGTPGWRVEGLGKGSAQGRGWMMREYTSRGNPTGRMIRWHPGGGHHGPKPYWRVSGHEGDLFGIIR